MTGKRKNTIIKLLADTGSACATYQDQAMRSLTIKKVQVDEIWSFVGAKQKNVRDDHDESYGDWYTFTAIDPVTKLIPCWLVGTRSRQCAFDFKASLHQGECRFCETDLPFQKLVQEAQLSAYVIQADLH